MLIPVVGLRTSVIENVSLFFLVCVYLFLLYWCPEMLVFCSSGIVCIFLVRIAPTRNMSLGCKTFFMPNSAENGILNAHDYVKKVSIFTGSVEPRMLFFLLINVVGILTFMGRKNFTLS